MNPEDLMLSEISQTRKDKYSMIPLIGGPRGVRPTEIGSRWWGPGAGGGGGGVFNGDRVSVWEDEKVLEMGGGDGCTTM